MIISLLIALIEPPAHVPLTVTADPSVPIEIRSAAVYAVVKWNSAVGRRVFRWKVTGPADIVVRMVSELEDPYVGYWQHKREGCLFYGCVDVLNKPACPVRWRRIIGHELGHALGLNHSDSAGRRSIMRYDTPACGRKNPADEISIQLVRRVHELLPVGAP